MLRFLKKNMKDSRWRKILSIFALVLFVAMAASPLLEAKKPVPPPPPPVSPLAEDLQALVTEGNDLNTQLSGISLTADNLCDELYSANQAANAYINSITALHDGLSAPLSVDADILTALDDLSVVTLSLADEASALARDLGSLTRTAQMYDINDGLVAMLQLSDDIGTMADRILEMADNILDMADNIGTMADRIIATQELQNTNVALTQASILTTQENLLTLVSVINTSLYNADLQTLLDDGTFLAAQMSSIVLTPANMSTALAGLSGDAEAYMDSVVATDNLISGDTETSTLYINADSLTALMNLSIMTTSLGTALEGYAVAINGLAPLTSTPTLSDSMGSMLQLSYDIGVMADRILEMADVILAMADNIGLAADQILLIQQQQNINVAATQASILAAQEIMIALAVTYGL